MNGIYRITNLPTGRFYIGSAVNVERRWKRHIYDFKAQRHHNSKLQRAWNKYGEHAFAFELLEEVSDASMLLEREQHYMDALKPFYNINPKAGSNLGHKMPDSMKQKMATLRKAEWESMTPEQRKEKVERILNGARPKRHTEETRQKMSEAHKRKPMTAKQLANLERRNTPEAIAKRALSCSKTYIVTFPDGTETTVTNLKQFCRENDLSQAHMSSVATGKRKHHKGYKARETDPVYNAR